MKERTGQRPKIAATVAADDLLYQFGAHPAGAFYAVWYAHADNCLHVIDLTTPPLRLIERVEIGW